MKKFIFIPLLLAVCGLANATTPDVLVKFFGHTGISDKRSMYYGEMTKYFLGKPTLGETLPTTVKATFKKLNKSHNSMVYAVLLSDGHRTQNWYAFLNKDNGTWKLSAVRRLALSGIFYMALQQLERKSPRTKKEEWQYQNMLLTIKSDSALKKYLKDHLLEFKNIISLLSKGEKIQSKAAAKRLHLNFAKYKNGRFELNIGGILDNAVGYLYVPPGAKPPSMTPGEFICVEEIVDGWYLYKTT